VHPCLSKPWLYKDLNSSNTKVTVLLEYFVTGVRSIRVNACFLLYIRSSQFQLCEQIEQFWYTLGVWITEDPLYSTAIA